MASPAVLDQPGLFYPDVIAQNARYFAKKDAIVCGDDRLNWTEFHKRTNQVANAMLALGLAKGDRVCLLMTSSVRMFELLWGTIKAGGVIVPLNVMMANEALPVMINNAEPRFIFADSGTAGQIDKVRGNLSTLSADNFYAVGLKNMYWRSAEDFVDRAPDTDPAVSLVPADSMNIIYSSGTTGVPKGIEHSHFARLAYPCGYGPGLGVDRFTVTICTTPLYTNGTWITMLPTVYWGGTVVLLPKFSGRAFLETVQRERCTHTFMVPTQYIVILETGEVDKFDTASLRVLLTGGQPLQSKTFEQIVTKFPSAGLYETYGMTEGFLTLAKPGDWARGKRGSVGIPFFGCDLRVIDEEGKDAPTGELGEIVGFSPALMKGYYKDRKRTEDIIWRGPRDRTYIRSGDIGRFDDDGYLYIAGRTKDMIKSGGINVFASDIEEVFMGHPDVMEAAAIGIPHEKWGETPMLFVIMRQSSTTSPEELKRWGNERLGKYQRISRIEFRDEFPRATHDKVLKRALRDPFWVGKEPA
jgi:long-chain acyl-CoA synthetase